MQAALSGDKRSRVALSGNSGLRSASAIAKALRQEDAYNVQKIAKRPESWAE